MDKYILLHVVVTSHEVHIAEEILSCIQHVF